jgi:hypothetical protein
VIPFVPFATNATPDTVDGNGRFFNAVTWADYNPSTSTAGATQTSVAFPFALVSAPEPGTLALLGVGVVGLLVRRRARH